MATVSCEIVWIMIWELNFQNHRHYIVKITLHCTLQPILCFTSTPSTLTSIVISYEIELNLVYFELHTFPLLDNGQTYSQRGWVRINTLFSCPSLDYETCSKLARDELDSIVSLKKLHFLFSRFLLFGLIYKDWVHNRLFI